VRNPKRIPDVLRRLEKVWREHPDLRLGQIVSNATSSIMASTDPFYVEDDQMIDAIERGLSR
jgi:hypothetical protein